MWFLKKNHHKVADVIIWCNINKVIKLIVFMWAVGGDVAYFIPPGDSKVELQ